jgi:ADP-ribose pyrophosphatase YjhB (NUDIX family)
MVGGGSVRCRGRRRRHRRRTSSADASDIPPLGSGRVRISIRDVLSPHTDTRPTPLQLHRRLDRHTPSTPRPTPLHRQNSTRPRLTYAAHRLPGGAIDLGESLPQPAIRETKEETGIDIAITGLVGIYTNPNHCIEYIPSGEVRQELSIVLTARPTGGHPTPSDERWSSVSPGTRAELTPVEYVGVCPLLVGSRSPLANFGVEAASLRSLVAFGESDDREDEHVAAPSTPTGSASWASCT